MGGIEGLAGEETLEWLLEKGDPSVRYFTLRDLLGRGEKEKEVVAARKAILAEGPAARILGAQEEGGQWGEAERFYLDKYRGSTWQLLVLGELGLPEGEPRAAAACEFLLANSQDPSSGGFSVHLSGREGGGRHSEVIPCLTGNMAASLVRLGYGGDGRVGAAIDWICRYQRADDGEGKPPAEWPYDRYEMCWGRHSCHLGVVKSLKALASLPASARTPAVKRKTDELTGYLLAHHIHKKSHDPSTVSRPGWLKFGFPLMYQTDVLEILDILTSLGVHDGRMEEAVGLVRSKRGANGRWRLETSFNGRMVANIEKKGADSKWITLRALRVLSRWEA